MKKIMFLMLMFAGLMSSLYALDTITGPSCDIQKSQMNGIESYSPAPLPTQIVLSKIDIMQRDTLLYSWGEGLGNKGKNVNSIAVICSKSTPKIGGGYSNETGDFSPA